MSATRTHWTACSIFSLRHLAAGRRAPARGTPPEPARPGAGARPTRRDPPGQPPARAPAPPLAARETGNLAGVLLAHSDCRPQHPVRTCPTVSCNPYRRRPTRKTPVHDRVPSRPPSRRTAQRARRALPSPQPPASRNRGSCLPRGSRTPPGPRNRDPVPRSNRPSARLDAQAGRLRRTSCLRGAWAARALRRNDSASRDRRASTRRESSEAPGPRLRQPTPGPVHDL